MNIKPDKIIVDVRGVPMTLAQVIVDVQKALPRVNPRIVRSVILRMHTPDRDEA